MVPHYSLAYSNARAQTCNFFDSTRSRRIGAVPRKTRTLDQIRAVQDKAVRFLRDVIGDPERAEEFAAMSPEEYAEHKRVAIENPTLRRLHMRRPTYAELKDRVAELEEENQALNEKLDSIVDIASEEEDEEVEDGDEDDLE